MKNVFILFLLFLISTVSFAQKVLQIGNSHTVGPFGESLTQELRHHSLQVRSVGLIGASGSHYASENEKKRTLNYGFIDRKTNGKEIKVNGSRSVEKLSTYINDEEPDIVVIELGDNFANYSGTVKNINEVNSNTFAKSEVKKILAQLDSSQFNKKCFWVGPTWTDKSGNNIYKKTNARAKALSDLIKKTVEPRCAYIDSTVLLDKNEVKTSSDGLHMSAQTGQLWGKRTAAEILKGVSNKKTVDQKKSAPQNKPVNISN